jgi:hypothetical protein
MKKLVLFAFLFVLVSGCTTGKIHHAPLMVNDQYGLLAPGDAHLETQAVVIPQWHLASSTTTTVSSAGLPQSENQRAIYRQLIEWVEAGQIQTVIVEGCEGEIDDHFSSRFNGWSLEDLQKLSAEQLDNTMTHVGLKLKAKVGRKVHVLCGDSEALIKKHQLILSDMRGLLGFKLRIDQFKNEPKKRADYVATARELLKLPTDADEDAVIAEIDKQLRSNLAGFNEVLHQRNTVFVSVTKKASPVDAIVIGAIHIDDLIQQLHDAKVTTQTFTPKGLKGDESELLGQIRALLEKPPASPDE